jgi:serine/threonine-protein kinase
VICPRCSVAEISPLTNRCELCGFAPDGTGVTVAAAVASGVDEPARRELGHLFHFDAILGVTDQSAVYLARTLASNQHLVLKVVRRPAQRRPDHDERFRRAAEIAAGLEHPNVVPVLGSGATDTLFWYTMEHQRAHSLRLTLSTRGPLDVRSTLRLVAQIGAALDYGHRRGVVHGALKPENVLIDADGWVHVCDALIARACEVPAVPGPPGARPAHVAPEDWTEGTLAPSADQWALAVLVHECLTGMVPAEAAETPIAPVAPVGAARPDIPVHVAQALRRALSPKPADRFPSVLDFLAALETPARVTLPDARPTGRAAAQVITIPDWQPPPRAPIPVRAIAIGAMALAVIGAAVLWVPGLVRRRQPPIYDAPARPAAPAPAPRADSAAARAPDPAPPTSLRPIRPSRRTPSTTAARVPDTGAPAQVPAAAPDAPTRTARPAATPVRPPPAPAAVAETGLLSVNATPWGQLYVDGQLIGNTPRVNLTVTAGTHTIRVVRDGYEPADRVVTVGAGQTVRVTDIVLVERQP